MHDSTQTICSDGSTFKSTNSRSARTLQLVSITEIHSKLRLLPSPNLQLNIKSNNNTHYLHSGQKQYELIYLIKKLVWHIINSTMHSIT